ncbi:MAG: sigma-70 family RNA polymerase sigma factor [Candidatus Latescibacterota bacterium]|jgi:RNA polymerase sigma factor (TIGR02999 family)
MTTDKNQITLLLGQLSDGKRDAVDQLMPLVYEQLQAMAKRQMRSERANHTLNSTALVHEAYLKLVDQTRVTWQNRAHFFAVAAQAMRRILVNYANRRLAAKRGGGQIVATFNDDQVVRETRADELVALDAALEELGRLDERQSKVVELRFFAGLTQEETAEVLGVSVPTVRRDWRLARAWLGRHLEN